MGATGLSRIGDAIRIFALTLWVYSRTGHSGPAIAALTLAQTLPAVAVGVARLTGADVAAVTGRA